MSYSLRRSSIVLTALAVVITTAGVAAAPTVLDARVAASVIASGDVFLYGYTVTNDPSSSASVWRVVLDMAIEPGAASLSSDGLTSGDCLLSEVAARVAASSARVRTVPVGLSAPSLWTCAPSLDGTVQWGAPELVSRIVPGRSVAGFQLSSRGLPGIRTVILEPRIEVTEIGIQPPKDDSQAEIGAYLRQVATLKRRASFKTATVAPSAPPANFRASEFLQIIIGYKAQALQIGWIHDQGIRISLDAKLNEAQAALERGQNSTATNILKALIQEVDAQAGKQLSSEAVALLKFNTQYLIGKLQ